MSLTRLQEMLQSLYGERSEELLQNCLRHPDFTDFRENQGIKVPLENLVIAFTHTSFAHEYQVPHQETIEFLGDAVLQLLVTEELYRLYSHEKEGRLSKLRSSIVNEKTLAGLARGLKLDELILVGKGEYKKGHHQQDTILSDTFEALLGQMYLFQGFEETRAIFHKWLGLHAPSVLEISQLEEFDAKSKVQEASLSRFKKLPRYTAEARGTNFEVKLWINDELLAEGEFTSKKGGEKALAQEVLKKNLI